MEAHPKNIHQQTLSFLKEMKIISRYMSKERLKLGGSLFLFCCLLLVSVGQEIAASYIMTVISGFYLTISQRNGAMFLAVLWKSLLISVLVSLLKSMTIFFQDWCAVAWRKALVSSVQSQYLSGKLSSTGCPLVYALVTEGKLDNPDQRLSQDLDLFTRKLSEFTQKTIVVPGLIVYYTWFIWKLLGWPAPAACYIFFFAGALVNAVLLKRIVPYIYLQEQYEGQFRYDHSWFKVHIEPIALYKGFEAENKRISLTFQNVITNQKRVVMLSLPLYISQNLFGYVGSIVNYAAVGGAILYSLHVEGASEAEISSLIATGSYSCLYLLNAFTILIQTSKLFSEINGLVTRISELLRALDLDTDVGQDIPENINLQAPLLKTDYTTLRVQDENENKQYSQPETSVFEAHECYSINSNGTESLTLYSSGINDQITKGSSEEVCPVLLDVENLHISLNGSLSNSVTDRILINSLTFQLSRGQSLLITGPSGCGKSSLVRVVGGLWNADSGTVTSRDQVSMKATKMSFIAQKPYCFRGTLGAQMMYPNLEVQPDDLSKFSTLLEQLGLENILDAVEDPWGQVHDWPQILSPGEQQRLCLSRVLLQTPDLVFLDESTSSMDEENEDTIYSILRSLNVAIVSIGHRSNLLKHHNLHLLLGKCGQWSLTEISH